MNVIYGFKCLLFVAFLMFFLNPMASAVNVGENFKSSNKLITDYLGDLEEAQLHFFWTTGRTLSDNMDYQPNLEVNVGGSEYGTKFFDYVDLLLQNSPSKLKIKFICDNQTLTANHDKITALSEKYSDRFEVIDIKTVENNLLKVFPNKTEKIKTIFKNATQGNPVSASDIYRVIGMTYANNEKPDVLKKQYTYVDIDTFCSGMEHKQYIDLIKDLFESRQTNSFYFGRNHKNNDLIKIVIVDMEKYKKFCEEILSDIQEGYYVLTYFSKLHDIIKLFETDPKKASEVFFNLKSLHKSTKMSYLNQVMSSTGPTFLNGLNITKDLNNYPKIWAGAWRTPEEDLDDQIANPRFVLDWGYSEETEKEKELKDILERESDIYRKFISAAFYAQRFGKNHPFNLFLNEYLATNFPYNKKYFKELLDLNFMLHKTDKPQELKLTSKIPSGNKFNKDTLYLEKKDNHKLNYTMLGPDEKIIEGTLTLDIKIKDDLNPIFLRKNKNEILKQATLVGLKASVKKGKSFDEWLDLSWDNLTRNHNLHLVTLMRLLGELGITMNFTKESLKNSFIIRE